MFGLFTASYCGFLMKITLLTLFECIFLVTSGLKKAEMQKINITIVDEL